MLGHGLVGLKDGIILADLAHEVVEMVGGLVDAENENKYK